MTRRTGRGLRAAVRVGVAALAGVAGWFGYHLPDQLTWLPASPWLPAMVAVGAWAVCAGVARWGLHRGELAYGRVATPRGTQPGIVARLRTAAVGAQLAALASVPAVTGLVLGVDLAYERPRATVIAGVVGLTVSLLAAHALRVVVQRGLTVGITGDGVRMGGHFVPWGSVHRVYLVGRVITMEVERPAAVQPPMSGLLPKNTLQAALLRVPAEPVVATIEFYRRNPGERARLAYPYPDGARVITPGTP